jgi:hypothetical protein
MSLRGGLEYLLNERKFGQKSLLGESGRIIGKTTGNAEKEEKTNKMFLWRKYTIKLVLLENDYNMQHLRTLRSKQLHFYSYRKRS